MQARVKIYKQVSTMSHFTQTQENLNTVYSIITLVINFIACQKEIVIKALKQYSIIQGEIQYEELRQYNEMLNYDLFTGIQFFHFIATRQLLMTITIKPYIEFLTSYQVIIYENLLGQELQKQCSYYENQHYSLLDEGEYFLMIAGPQNLQFSINLQTDIISTQFIYLTQTTSINLNQQNAIKNTHLSYILLKSLLGQCQIIYSDNPQIIEIPINHIVFVFQEFTILVTKDPVVLFTKSESGIFIFSEQPVYFFIFKNTEVYIKIYVPNYIMIKTQSPLVTRSDLIQVKNHLQYDLIINNLYSQQNYLIQLDVNFKAYHVDPHRYENIQIDTNSSLVLLGNNFDIRTIQGKYEVKDLGYGRKLIQTQSFILISLYPLIQPKCKLINLFQVYKFRKSDTQLCFIKKIQIEFIKFNFFPADVAFNIRQNDKQFAILDISPASSFYYIFLERMLSQMMENKESIISLMPLFIYNSTKFQLLKAYQNQPIKIDNDVISNRIIATIQDNLAFVVKYTYYGIQLFNDTLNQLQNHKHYILVMDVNIIAFEIQNPEGMFSIFINVQSFDSNRLVKYPESKEQSDFAYSNQTSKILNLELYDCLAYDCVIKLSVEHNLESLQLKYIKCNLDININQIYFEFDSQLFFCKPVNYSSIIILQGQIIYSEDNYLYTCVSNHCAILIVGKEHQLQMYEQLFMVKYLLQVNTLIRFEDLKQTRYILIVKELTQFLIHSNTKIAIRDIIQNTELSSRGQNIELKEGIYLFEFSQVVVNSYTTIFTLSTILYQHILFQVEGEERFLLENSIYQFIVIEFREIVIFEYIHLEHNCIYNLSQPSISLQIPNNGSLMTLNGQFKFTVRYTNHPCFLINLPIIKEIERSDKGTQMVIKFKINDQCLVQAISINYNSIQNMCSNFQCILILDQASDKTSTLYELIIQSPDDYEYKFTYAINLVVQDNLYQIILKISLILLLSFLLYTNMQ